jgi:hypothetical protein
MTKLLPVLTDKRMMSLSDVEMDDTTEVDSFKCDDRSGSCECSSQYRAFRDNPVALVDPMGLFASQGQANGHRVATQQGLAGTGLSQKVIGIIVNANEGQDAGARTNDYPFNDPTNHGDNSMLADTLDFMNWRWGNIRGIAGKGTCTSCEELRTALEDFGKILHAIQDLYSHSNYIEMMNAQFDVGADINGNNTIPLWPMSPGSTDIPDGVYTGNYTWHVPLPWLKDPSPQPTHDQMAKDSPDSPAGRVVNFNGNSMYELALDAATRATSEAWRQFVQMFPDILSQIKACEENGARN